MYGNENTDNKDIDDDTSYGIHNGIDDDIRNGVGNNMIASLTQEVQRYRNTKCV